MRKTAFQYVLWKEGKHYVTQCLNFDVASFGKTKNEAVKNIEEAVSLYLEDMPKKNLLRVNHAQIGKSLARYA